MEGDGERKVKRWTLRQFIGVLTQGSNKKCLFESWHQQIVVSLEGTGPISWNSPFIVSLGCYWGLSSGVTKPVSTVPSFWQRELQDLSHLKFFTPPSKNNIYLFCYYLSPPNYSFRTHFTQCTSTLKFCQHTMQTSLSATLWWPSSVLTAFSKQRRGRHHESLLGTEGCPVLSPENQLR